ncbi:MAG: alpha/beta hydrolase [Polyangiaceae bacterium]|nr:alpha/beta hydrolase [Polyangiaceae bacterium]
MTVRWHWIPIIRYVGTASLVCACGSAGADTASTGPEAAAGSSSGTETRASGTGGTGTRGVAIGRNDFGGADTTATGGASSADGRATGGASAGGAAAGAQVAGGAEATGGKASGGHAAGGVSTGGTATGGANTIASGGVPASTGAAGASSGGTGGTATPSGGRTSTGGASSGGTAAGTSNTGAGAGGDAGSPGTASPSCLDGITDYASNGPFSYSTKSSGKVNMWIPKVPSGCKVPMVHYSNGTGASCSYYALSLVRLASHGFLSLCYEDTNTGAGTFGIEAFKTALAQYPDVADYRFGSIGHSQGGMASLVSAQYAESEWGDEGMYAALAVEPASGFGDNPAESWQTVYGRIKSPVFMFSGLGTDTLVSQSWVQQAFDALSSSVEAYFWAKRGANHLTTVNEDANEVSISWFRWKLLGDQKACQYFKAIPATSGAWTVVDEQNDIACK